MTATLSTPLFLIRSSVEAGAVSALAELVAAIAAPARATVVRASLRFMAVLLGSRIADIQTRRLDYFCIQFKMQYGILNWTGQTVRALFVDANDTLAAVTEKLLRTDNLPVGINRNPSIKPDELPGLLGDA